MPETGASRVGGPVYAGLFAITLATIMYEILLTRIFSVSMWYHFAFVAISIAMFGMSFGAIFVYLAPALFSGERAPRQLASSSLGFALAIPLSFVTHLQLPFWFGAGSPATLALTYLVIAIPFVLSGICVCIALTRFPEDVSRLYAADLLGAALGCVALIYLLDWMDGPSAVFVVAAAAAAGAWSFARAGAAGRLRTLAASVVVLFALSGAGHAVLASSQRPLLQLSWVKGKFEPRPLYETWNAFSRVTVHGDPATPTWPSGWGMSAAYRPPRPIRQLQLLIDATAGTVLTGFDGTSFEHLDHLRHDVTNLAHHLRSDGSVLVLGVGGGRDVLSALMFGQRRVVAVDMNDDILEVVNQRFGDYTGHLDRHPAVTFVHDEARSYVARQDERFDVIQASLVDTFTASAAGAYMLSEHAIYTVEAWTSFLTHLTPNGILTFSRFYLPGLPGETHRLTALASAALRRIGVERPREHIVVAKNEIARGRSWQFRRVSGSTLLVSPSPFSERDLDELEGIAERMRFEILVSPRAAVDRTFEVLAAGEDLDGHLSGLPVDLSAPTDDKPFFFFMLRPRSALGGIMLDQGDYSAPHKGIRVLVTLLLVVLGLTALCIFAPLLVATRRGSMAGGTPFVVFFAAIGVGFMFVEISQLQRLSIFLGHPTYGLSVVLFALLLSSGLGSWTVQRVPPSATRRAGLLRLALLVGCLVAVGLLTPHVTETFHSATTAWRIGVSVALLFPIGLAMGMAFPLGMRVAARVKPALTPWLWGVNGATSVCASVVALVLALLWGITTAYWAGVACYGGALLCFALAERPR